MTTPAMKDIIDRHPDVSGSDEETERLLAPLKPTPPHDVYGPFIPLARATLKSVHPKLEETHAHIDGQTVARIIVEFNNEFRDIYPTGTHLCFGAVGPLQSLIGMAIKNGHLSASSGSGEPAWKQLRDAFEAARYQPGDHPIVPVKLDRFMKTVEQLLSQEPSE